MAKRLAGRTIESWAEEARVAWDAKEQAEAQAAELREILEHRDAQAERDAQATVRAMQEADARTMDARRERDEAVEGEQAAVRAAVRHRERASDRFRRIQELDSQLRALPVVGAAAYWKERSDQAQAQAARLRDRTAHQRQQIRELTARHVITKKGFESQARTIGRLQADGTPVPAGTMRRAPPRTEGGARDGELPRRRLRGRLGPRPHAPRARARPALMTHSPDGHASRVVPHREGAHRDPPAGPHRARHEARQGRRPAPRVPMPPVRYLSSDACTATAPEEVGAR
jgi:hypothetical protein